VNNLKISQIFLGSNDVKDTAIKFSRLLINLSIGKEIVYNSSSSGYLYACDPTITEHLVNPIDSVSITLNKDYGSIKAGQSILSQLRIFGSNQILTEPEFAQRINENSSFISFSFISPPSKQDTIQFNITIKDINDSIFTAKSKPILIFP